MLHTTDDSRGARDCFDKSQIVCREKIFEILPNTSRLYQSTENHKKCPNNRNKLHKYVCFVLKWAISNKLDFSKH